MTVLVKEDMENFYLTKLFLKRFSVLEIHLPLGILINVQVLFVNSLTFALSTKYKQQNLRTLKINLEGEVGVRAFPSDCLKTFNIWLFKYLTFEWTRLERAKTNNWKCLLKVLSSNLQLNEIGIGYSSNSQITLDWPPAPSLSGSSLKIVQLKFLLSLLNYWINTWSRLVMSPTQAFQEHHHGHHIVRYGQLHFFDFLGPRFSYEGGVSWAIISLA